MDHNLVFRYPWSVDRASTTHYGILLLDGAQGSSDHASRRAEEYNKPTCYRGPALAMDPKILDQVPRFLRISAQLSNVSESRSSDNLLIITLDKARTHPGPSDPGDYNHVYRESTQL